MTTPTLSERLRLFAVDYTTTTYHDALIVEAADALDARDSEIDRLRAELAISRPPLPVRMADCNVYCATAKELIEDVDRLRAENARLLADAERLGPLDSHGRYWVENRGRIIDAVTAAGFRLMSNAEGFWLQPLSARVVPPVIIAANLDSTR